MRPELTSPQDEFENGYLSSKFPLAIDPSHVALATEPVYDFWTEG